MRTYFLGDIHGNLEALETSLAHIDRYSPDAIYCLGDIVGWLPFGDRTLKRMQRLGLPTVAGNHDLMAVGRFVDHPQNTDRMQATAYTSGLLSTIPGAWQYLGGLPLLLEERDFIVVHHSPFHLPEEGQELTINAFGYLDEKSLEECLDAWNHCNKYIIFSGHDHDPSVFELPQVMNPRLQDVIVHRPRGHEPLVVKLRRDRKYWVKAGSIGGPYRDGVPVANIVCYNDLEETLTLERIPYPTERLAAELEAHPYFRNLATIKRLIDQLRGC